MADPSPHPGSAADTEPEALPSSENETAGGGQETAREDQAIQRGANETRTTEAIAAVVKENRDKARACYEKVQKDVPSLKGDVVIQFVLNSDGTVKLAHLNQDRSTLQEPAVVSCVIDVVRAIRFPRSSRGMETKVNYPFNFNP